LALALADGAWATEMVLPLLSGTSQFCTKRSR
jgi:hypothetical protein